MAVRIGSNISSLQSQRRLGEAAASLSKTYERLSSGQRINRASDDAAGLAIASTLNASARIFGQGVRNVNDSISFYTIAQGATGELKNIIIRAKELAEQSANGAYSDAQRKALDSEIQTLGQEYNRILDTTKFNGRKVFSRPDSTLVTQAGDSTLSTQMTADRAAAVDTIQPISVGLGGAEADNDSRSNGKVSISADGRYVVFESAASNLVAGDTIGDWDVFVKDLQTGDTERVSTSGSGAEGNSGSGNASISADGRYVVFESMASNLVDGDTNDDWDIFVKDLQTGGLQRVSTSGSGGEGNNISVNASISADGRYVAFESMASNLVDGDTNDDWDIFVKDLQTGGLQRVSTSGSGGEGSGNSFDAFISADGRYVVFESLAANLVAGDTNDQRDIFVKDLKTGGLERVSTSGSGAEGNDGSYNSSINADGRYVVFESLAANLVAGDTNGRVDVFVKDLKTGGLERVSTSGSGAEGNDGSYNSSISADGRYVVFESYASNLVAGDTNGGPNDIFVKDLNTGDIKRLSVSQSGREGTDSRDGYGNFNASMSADGRYVFFSSDLKDLLDGPETGDIFSVYAVSNSLAEQFSLTRFQWVNVKTQSEALNAIPWMNEYLDELNVFQGNLGASMSRLETAVSGLESSQENFKAAESRITDADIASESANLVRTEIVQQAATAVLAQANQQPRIAVLLLGG